MSKLCVMIRLTKSKICLTNLSRNFLITIGCTPHLGITATIITMITFKLDYTVTNHLLMIVIMLRLMSERQCL